MSINSIIIYGPIKTDNITDELFINKTLKKGNQYLIASTESADPNWLKVSAACQNWRWNQLWLYLASRGLLCNFFIIIPKGNIVSSVLAFLSRFNWVTGSCPASVPFFSCCWGLQNGSKFSSAAKNIFEVFWSTSHQWTRQWEQIVISSWSFFHWIFLSGYVG